MRFDPDRDRDRDRGRDRDRDGKDRDRSSTGASPSPGRRMKKKTCRFCADFQMFIDYKEARLLTAFVTDRGKMIPRRVTGNCAFHQRRITESIKRARILALLPFTGNFSG